LGSPIKERIIKDLLGVTILVPTVFVAIWMFGIGAGPTVTGLALSEPRLSQLDGGPARQSLIMRPVKGVPSPAPTPSGRWVYYKTDRITYYNETGNLTALEKPYITGPMDSLAAVDGEDRWLLGGWLLLVWEDGEAVVFVGDLCGECAAEDVAVDLSPGLHARLRKRGMAGQVEVYYWEEESLTATSGTK